MEKRKIYVGLDVGNRYAMISYYNNGMREPETVSKVAGSEVYQVPLMLYKRKGIGQWFYGEEAALMAKGAYELVLDDLFNHALKKDKVVLEEQEYSYLELLTLFLKKMLK